MVSGFFTSPKDRSRIFSGEEMEILIAEKCKGSFGLSKKLKRSSNVKPPYSEEFILRRRENAPVYLG
jgi:hypothetical protein